MEDIFALAVSGLSIGAMRFASLETDANIIRVQSKRIISALVKMCEQDSTFRTTMLRLTKQNAQMSLVIALAMTALPIAANHGLIPGTAGMMLTAAGQMDIDFEATLKGMAQGDSGVSDSADPKL